MGPVEPEVEDGFGCEGWVGGPGCKEWGEGVGVWVVELKEGGGGEGGLG